jgi:phosphatidate cytidylyltransferase
MTTEPPEIPAQAPVVPPAGGGAMADLKVRVVSGLALAGIALALLYAGPMPFAVLILAVSLAMCWEWGHVVRGAETDPVLVVHGVVVVAAVILAALGYAALAVIALIAGAFVVAALRFGETARLSALGVLYVGLPAVALITLRNEAYGFLAVLFVVLTVIATDTLAYFTGRGLGGPKLWPRVSPKKTWSGLAGGVSGAALVGAGFGATLPGASIGRLAAVGLLLGLVALKRSFDVKDASGLLPGHGGFMDRMDGLVVASVVAILIGLSGSMFAPARALLLGF